MNIPLIPQRNPNPTYSRDQVISTGFALLMIDGSLVQVRVVKKHFFGSGFTGELSDGSQVDFTVDFVWGLPLDP